MQLYKHPGSFPLELGSVIDGLEIAYHTYGEMNDVGDNVVWICHALTANSDVASWWEGMVGPGKFYDSSKYFIICANVLGSCYGTTGPLSTNLLTGKPYLHEFPEITVRDMVKAHELLREHLGITRIHTVVGGSIGGFQSMEWALARPELFEHIILIACSEKASPWVIAFNESQRLAILADKTFMEGLPDGGLQGLKAARSIALLSYRTSEAYDITQAEFDGAPNRTIDFRASSYQRYQGEKLIKRYNTYSYYIMTRIVDSHSISRGRDNVNELLGKIKARTLVVGITSDILYPVHEQKQLASIFPCSQYAEIRSDFGHDGFLLENEQLSEIFTGFYLKKEVPCL